MQIVESIEKTLKTNFKWRDRGGNFHLASDMATRHIFYTVKMIYNHVVPDNFRLKPYKQYVFGDFYTLSYIKEAIEELLTELSIRNDLTPAYLQGVDFMIKSFVKLNKGLE